MSSDPTTTNAAPRIDPTKAILTDITKCIGCEECVLACKKDNGLGPDRMWKWQRSIDELSASRYTTVLRRQDGKFVRQQCRHCVDPACVSACIVGALKKTPEGSVVYDKDKCIGCRYCMLACPFGIPRYNWEATVPLIKKCDMCHDPVVQGGVPACTKACPTKATIFGPRSEMLAEARRRLAAEPRKYIQKVYGEHEVGGTSVLYVSDIPLDFLAWQKAPGDNPLPKLTWGVQKEVPAVAAGGFGLLGGVYWVIGRRMSIAAGGKGAHAKPSGALKTAAWAPMGILASGTVAHLAGAFEGAFGPATAAAWTVWLMGIIVTGVGIGAGVSWLAERKAGNDREDR